MKIDAEPKHPIEHTIGINFDGNFQQKRIQSAVDYGHFDTPPVFSLDDEFEDFERTYANHVRKDSQMKSSCHDRFKAGNEKRQGQYYETFDEVGLMICECRHGCVFKSINIKRSGEK